MNKELLERLRSLRANTFEIQEASDLIEAQSKEIEELKQLLKAQRPYNGRAMSVQECDEQNKELRAAQVAVPEWISVSDRLPDAYEVCNLKLKDGSERIGRINATGLFQFAEFLHLDTQHNKYPPIEQRINQVSYWQALQQPPKEGL